MTVSRKVLCLAVLVGGWSLLSPTFAEARTRPRAKNQALRALVTAQQSQGVSPDLGFGSIPLPLIPQQVNRFLRNYARRPFPPISRDLQENPFAFQFNARRAFALEVFRQRALLKPSQVAGGVFFAGGAATTFFPVAANNFLVRLPIFRVLGVF